MFPVTKSSFTEYLLVYCFRVIRKMTTAKLQKQ